MPGEVYVQNIIELLNGVSVRGSGDMNRMMNAIYMLERLKKDIVEHKAQPTENMTPVDEEAV